VERGRHEELLAADGLYAELYRVQFQGQEAGRGAEAAPGAEAGIEAGIEAGPGAAAIVEAGIEAGPGAAEPEAEVAAAAG
jgi:hypothetical protein